MRGCIVFLFGLLSSSLVSGGDLEWDRLGRVPDGVKPQGITIKGGQIILSAHRNDVESLVYRFDETKAEFLLLFKMPKDATHTSGIAFHPKDNNLFFAVDYNSDKIYVLDWSASVKSGTAELIASVNSGYRGTSACCFVSTKRHGDCLVVTDFMNSQQNQMFGYDRETSLICPVEGQSYQNMGFSQGVAFHGGYVYETGNRLIGQAYIVRHKLSDSIGRGRVAVDENWNAPAPKIEDLCFDKAGRMIVTDEQFNFLYRSKKTF